MKPTGRASETPLKTKRLHRKKKKKKRPHNPTFVYASLWNPTDLPFSAFHYAHHHCQTTRKPPSFNSPNITSESTLLNGHQVRHIKKKPLSARPKSEQYPLNPHSRDAPVPEPLSPPRLHHSAKISQPRKPSRSEIRTPDSSVVPPKVEVFLLNWNHPTKPLSQAQPFAAVHLQNSIFESSELLAIILYLITHNIAPTVISKPELPVISLRNHISNHNHDLTTFHSQKTPILRSPIVISSETNSEQENQKAATESVRANLHHPYRLHKPPPNQSKTGPPTHRPPTSFRSQHQWINHLPDLNARTVTCHHWSRCRLEPEEQENELNHYFGPKKAPKQK